MQFFSQMVLNPRQPCSPTEGNPCLLEMLTMHACFRRQKKKVNDLRKKCISLSVRRYAMAKCQEWDDCRTIFLYFLFSFSADYKTESVNQ